MIVGQDTLVVLLHNVFRNSFHAENLDIKTNSIRESIVNGGEVFFVDLAHMDTQATCCVQSPATSFTLEVLCLLVVDQNLEIVEVAFAVVAPGSREDLFDVRVMALLLRHVEV